MVTGERTADARADFYTRVYRQAFSPDGDWLVCADSRGRLCVFSVRSALASRSGTSSSRATARVLHRAEPVYALHSAHAMLLGGDARGRLFAFHWNGASSLSSSSAKAVFDVDGFASGSNAAAPNEINCICSLGDRIVYAGAGRYAVEMVDLEEPSKVVRSFPGHEDYINEVAVRNDNEFLSASEDGTVRVWDARTKHGVHAIRVADEGSLKAAGTGKGVCALAVDDSFMVCGGDVGAAIWHLGSFSLATVLQCDAPLPSRFTVAQMSGEKILVGGTSPLLFQFTYDGRWTTSVETSSRALYSIERNGVSGRQMTTVAGDSTKIDALLSLGYVSFSFDCSSASESLMFC